MVCGCFAHCYANGLQITHILRDQNLNVGGHDSTTCWQSKSAFLCSLGIKAINKAGKSQRLLIIIITPNVGLQQASQPAPNALFKLFST